MQTPPSKAGKSTLIWLRRQSRLAVKWILLALGTGLASGILLVLQAHLIARLVHDAFLQASPQTAVMPVLALLVGLTVVRSVLVWCRQQAGFHAGARVRGHVREAIVEQMMASGPVAIGHVPTGKLVSGAMEQVEALHDFVAHYLPQLALAATLPLVILAFVFPVSWAAGGILLVTAPLIPVFMVLVGMGAESISQRHFQALARMSAHFLDVLRGLTTLKLFGQAKSQTIEISAMSAQYRRRTMAVLKVAFLSSAVLEFFSAIAIALVAVYLGMYFLGYIDFGAYGKPVQFSSGFFILLLAPEFFLPLRELGTHYHSRANAVGAAEEILQILRQIEPQQRMPEPVSINAPRTIRFDGVSVRYAPDRRRALIDLDLTVGSGERIAIVGESGAGKSSLLHLLLGFIAPETGDIYADQQRLNPASVQGLRRHCAWVGQAHMLFSGTIRENIAMGNPRADDSRIEAAAMRAGVTAFLDSRPGGLDFRLGEQGQGLSAGQAQRVALARALVRSAPILLMDEPTASLDKGTEAQIVKDLGAWPRDCTMVIASHRGAVLSIVDRIVVLRRGEVIAQGTYAALRGTHGDVLPKD